MDSKKRIETLEATLGDTERILFNTLVEKALRHCTRADPTNAKAYNDLLAKRLLLIAARRKRPGKIR